VSRDDAEVARRRLVRLIFLIYWLLIFEGVLRKWVLPQAQQYLFFVRDPVVLFVYFLVLRDRLWPRFSLLLVGIGILSVAGLALVFGALFQGSASPVVVAYGWRNYFLYFPLAFIIGTYFSPEDLRRLLRQTLLIAIPIALLVVLQFLAPPDAIVNAGLIEGGVYQPGVFGGLVRTYGTFTSSSGQTPFIASLVAMLLTAWILPREHRPLGAAMLVVVSAAVITCLALSGSRGAFITTGLLLACALGSSFLLPQRAMRLRARVVPLVLLALSVLLVLTVFADASQALWERSAGAYAAENEVYGFGTLGRAMSIFTDFLPLVFNTPLFGFGIGKFSNAFGVDYLSLLPASASTESDWARNVAELGPVIGLGYIAFRIALVFVLARGAIVGTLRLNSPLPLMLFGSCGILLLAGQITGQGTVHGFAWLYAGLCMASNGLQATARDGE
jgi:hypothetical protein